MGAMIELLCRTIELFRRKPVLWLPYLVAELLSVGLWRLWGVVRGSIFHWFTVRHSALGVEVPASGADISALTKASQLAIPIGFLAVFTIVCFFVIAFMTTASLVDAINREQNIDARGILAGFARRLGRILLFSLVTLLTYGAFMGAAAALLFFIPYLTHRPDLRTSPVSTFGLLPVSVGAATWVLMPMAIRLLRADATVRVPCRIRNLGALFAALAVETSGLLGVILTKAEGRVQLESQFGWSMLAAFNSVVANIPDALLFIAIALLAAEYVQTAEAGRESRVRALLPTLMPMHFRETKEPE